MIYALEDEENRLQYLILEFLEDYQLCHSDEKTMKLVKAILSKKEISILPEELKRIEKEELSRELERLIIEKAHDEEYKDYHLDKFYPIFMPDKKAKPSYKLKKAAMIGSIIAITTMTGVSGAFFGSKSKKSEKDSIQSNVSVTQVTSTNTTPPIEENLSTTQESMEELQKKKKELLKAEKEKLKKEKQKVLTTFSKCKSIKQIKLRQKQLEKLKLTKKDKIYKNVPLSAALQHFIYEQSIVNGYPADLMITIIDVETRGKFDSSGSASYNKGNNTYDLGLTQQNSKEPLLNFCKVYNTKYNTAYKLVQNNDYVNICAAFVEFDEIRARLKVFDEKEFSGCYNGWLNWREKEISLEYVELFMNTYNNVYTKHHQVEEKKAITKTKKK